jgi:DNA-directed RNA polymerase subunit RPC12/RpoP
MQLDKFSTCKKMIYLLLGFQLLCCCGVLVALKLELDFQTICLLGKVIGRLFMVIDAICLVLSILLVRYSRCTNCGKPVLMRFIEYKRMLQMKNGEKIECPHCKSMV